MEVGVLNSKSVEVNGTKPKSLRYEREECLTDGKRAEQGTTLLGSQSFYMGDFCDDFAAVDVREEPCYHSRPKKQIREAYFKRITAPKKSRAKNNTNSEREFVLFTHGAEDEIRTRATCYGTTPLAGEPLEPLGYFCISKKTDGIKFYGVGGRRGRAGRAAFGRMPRQVP